MNTWNAFPIISIIIWVQGMRLFVYFSVITIGEFVSAIFTDYFHRNGIEVKWSPYSPKQNEVANRYNRTLVEAIRIMLLEAGLPPSFWLRLLIQSFML